MSGQPRDIGRLLESLSQGANRLAEGAVALLLAVMTLLVGVQIAGRFVFGYSIFWSDEAARFLLIWISFLGISVGVRRGAHPGIDTLVRAAPTRAARGALALAIFCSIIFAGVLLVYGGVLAVRTWPQRSVSLGLRMSLPYLAVPACGLLMLLHTAAVGLRGGSPASPAEKAGRG